ncbi:regulation of autophagy [Balamuthia mandrillaris]
MPKGTRVAHNADNATTDLFCSGSNDSKICVWGRKNDGISLIASIVREEEENLHCLLALHNCVVTASTSPYLYVYSLEELGFCKKLAYHRESVRCLATITPSLFASASLDGSIVVWQSSNLQAFKVLEYPENYIQEKDYVFAVNHILPLGERYLAAAINDGFRVYDIPSATCVMQCKKAHDATVNRLIPLYNGTRIASCSVDSSIKLWGTAQALDFTQGAPNSSGSSSSSSSGSGYKKSRGRRFGTRLGLQSTPMLEPICLGEMLGHSGAVYSLLPCSNESFASCGADGLVILWKDGVVQSEMRNRLASAALYINLLESRAEQEEEEQEIDEQVEEEEEEEPSGGLEGNVQCEYINVGGEGAAVEEDSKIAGLAKEEHAPKTLLQDEEIVSLVDAVVLTDSSANTRTVF